MKGRIKIKGERSEIISGLTVFFLGIGLLCFTFYLAYTAFINPSNLSPFAELVPIAEEEKFGSLVKIAAYIIPLLLLWIMISIGGRITKNGIEMYKLKEKNSTEAS